VATLPEDSPYSFFWFKNKICFNQQEKHTPAAAYFACKAAIVK